MGLGGLQKTAVYQMVILAFHYGTDLVIANCQVPLCPRPNVTYPESIDKAEDCYNGATVVTIGCAVGFQQHGASYSVKCDALTGEWNRDGFCNLEVVSFITGITALLLVVLLGAMLIHFFRRHRGGMDVANQRMDSKTQEPVELTNVSSSRANQDVIQEPNNGENLGPRQAGRTGVPAEEWVNGHARTVQHCAITRVRITAYNPEAEHNGSNDVHDAVPPGSTTSTLAELHQNPSASTQGTVNRGLHKIDYQREESLDMYGPPTNAECKGNVSETEPSRDAAVTNVSNPPCNPNIHIHGNGNAIYMPT